MDAVQGVVLPGFATPFQHVAGVRFADGDAGRRWLGRSAGGLRLLGVDAHEVDGPAFAVGLWPRSGLLGDPVGTDGDRRGPELNTCVWAGAGSNRRPLAFQASARTD